MSLKKIILFVLLFIPIVNAQKKEIVAFLPEWVVKGDNPYYVKDIEDRGSADKITVLCYAFIVPQPDSTGRIIPGFLNPYQAYQQIYSSEISIDGIADDSTSTLRGQFNQLKKLKERHPNLKIVLSIGGWEGSKYFSDAALTPESRKFFVDQCLKIFVDGDLPEVNGAGGEEAAAGIFDGFDIDWEYPVNGGQNGIHHNSTDNDNLSRLFALFRSKLDSIRPGFLITASIPATEKSLNYYNLYNDQQYLDWYNVMTYDYTGEWDSFTGHMAGLLSSPADTAYGRERNSFDKTIRLLNSVYRISSSKLVPAAVFYGRGWGGVDSLNLSPGSTGSEIADDSTGGVKSFSDLKKLIGDNYQLNWDSYSMVPYLYSSEKKIFVTFDNEKSIALKSHYVEAYNLRGLMFWEISGDDSAGTLVDVIYNGNMPDAVPLNKTRRSTPAIEISQPSEKGWINQGSNIIIDTEYSDRDGKIIKVEFFADGISLGYTTEEPFNWVWFNVPQGNHVITASATDNNGSVIMSTPIDIDVKNR